VPAARLLGLADAMRRRSGGAMPPAERFDVDRAERRARATLGDAAFSSAFATGAATDRPGDDGSSVDGPGTVVDAALRAAEACAVPTPGWT
jgi:hypothetical protein